MPSSSTAHSGPGWQHRTSVCMCVCVPILEVMASSHLWWHQVMRGLCSKQKDLRDFWKHKRQESTHIIICLQGLQQHGKQTQLSHGHQLTSPEDQPLPMCWAHLLAPSGPLFCTPWSHRLTEHLPHTHHCPYSAFLFQTLDLDIIHRAVKDSALRSPRP